MTEVTKEGTHSGETKECANCGDVTDNYCIIQKCTQEENWIEHVWNKLEMIGKPICAECYYK